mmetsp:Transcript_32110/g.36514  ORF Transcript_32110/g.36514 Transcript_32110/m.36514 type:complete len:182 (+) Transcript_32110:43-588(+)
MNNTCRLKHSMIDTCSSVNDISDNDVVYTSIRNRAPVSVSKDKNLQLYKKRPTQNIVAPLCEKFKNSGATEQIGEGKMGIICNTATRRIKTFFDEQVCFWSSHTDELENSSPSTELKLLEEKPWSLFQDGTNPFTSEESSTTLTGGRGNYEIKALWDTAGDILKQDVVKKNIHTVLDDSQN